MSKQIPTLITAKEALKILTFVSYAGLYAGCKGTKALTRYPHGLFAKEECEALRDKILSQGIKPQSKKDRLTWNNRPVPTELV